MLANLLDDVWVNWAQVVWSEEFDHVVEDEQLEFEVMFGLLFVYLWQNLTDQLLDQLIAVSLMGLEENTEDFGKRDLKLVLILVFFLEHGKVLLIEFIIIIAVHLLFLILLVIFESVLGLGQELEDLFAQLFHT